MLVPGLFSILNIVIAIALLLFAVWVVWTITKSLESIAVSLRQIAENQTPLTVIAKEEL